MGRVVHDKTGKRPDPHVEPIGTRGVAAGFFRSAHAQTRGHRRPVNVRRLPVSIRRLPARPPPPISYKEELYHWLYYYYLRDFSACGIGRSKGLTLKEQSRRCAPSGCRLAGTRSGRSSSVATASPLAPAAALAAHSPHLSLGASLPNTSPSQVPGTPAASPPPLILGRVGPL
ncbi:hypothetical protein H8959_007844 [Pygathrix nigripes]